jgi:hypothetical protein
MRFEERTAGYAGTLLIAGFAFMIPGVAFAVSSQTGSDFVPPTFDARAGAILLAITMLLTMGGLLQFDAILWRAGDTVLSTIGTTAYVVGIGAWFAATIHALTAHRWTYGLEVTYIVAAGGSMLAFGGSILRTKTLPRWAGWTALGWTTGALFLFASPSHDYPPLLVQLVPLILGIALVRTAVRGREGRSNLLGSPP